MDNGNVYNELIDNVALVGKPGSAQNVSLSQREEDILCLISLGISNKDIADNYGISIRTIETHRLNIMRKFKMNSIEDIIDLAKKASII